MSAGAEIRCSICGASFACNPRAICWCKVPPYLLCPGGRDLFLPDCLAGCDGRGRAARNRDADAP